MLATVVFLAAAISGTKSSCAPDTSAPAALVSAKGFRDKSGNLRIAIYRANDEELLASGKYVQRIDVPVSATDSVTVCAPLPEPGKYVVVALHDRDASGKFGAFTDGVGFSQNPKLRLAKPRASEAAIHIHGVTRMDIRLNYLRGLRPAPWPAQQNR